MNSVAKNIRELRLREGLSQEELARLMSVSRATVCNYEKDTTTPGAEHMEKIAAIFNITISRLFVKEDAAQPLDADAFCGGLEILYDAYYDDKDILHLRYEQHGKQGEMDKPYDECDMRYFRIQKEDENRPYYFLENTQIIEHDDIVYACIHKNNAQIYTYKHVDGKYVFTDNNDKENKYDNLENVFIIGVVQK